MDANFYAHQFAISVTDYLISSIQSNGRGHDSENSSLIAKQMSATESAAATVSATPDTLQFFTLRLFEVLRRLKSTDRHAIYILTAPAEYFGHDTENLVIHRTSFEHLLNQFREARFA